MHATIDFICIGFVKLWGTWSKWELQNEKFLPTVGFDSDTPAYLADALSIAILISTWSGQIR